MTDLQRSIAIRERNRLKVNGLLSRVDELRSSNTEVGASELRVITEKIQRYAELLSQQNSEISGQLQGDDLDADLDVCVELQDKIWDAQCHLDILLQGLQGTPPASDIQSEHASAITSHQQSKIKYPKIELLKFDGKQVNWEEYWDRFNNSVHKSDMADIDKFQYLKSTLEGDAQRMVNGFRLTDANYKTVIEALLERYGDTELTIFAHFEQLLALPQASQDTQTLQSTYDDCERHIRSLVALGLEEETFGKVFSPIILSKLPKFIRVELHRRNGARPWDLNRLRELFKDELKARQMGEWSLGDKGSKGPKGNQPNDGQGGRWNQNNGGQGGNWGRNQAKGKPLTPTNTFIQQSKPQNNGSRTQPAGSSSKGAGSVQCIYCKGPHYSDQCTKFVNFEQRQALAIKGGHCFKCLSTKHPARKNGVQKGPTQRTVTFASTETPIQPMNPQAPTFAPQIPFASGQPFVAPYGNTYTHDQGGAFQSPQNHTNNAAAADGSAVYMQMAEVQFAVGQRLVPARLFFDPGSSSTYITTAKTRDLGLQPFGSTVVSNARFGDPNRSVRSYRTVSLSVPTLDGSTVPIDAFVTDVIAPNLQKLPLDLAKNPILRQLPLADRISDTVEQVTVDILIGEDHYYDFVSPEILRLGNGPYLIGSKLGYLTAGKCSNVFGVQQASALQAVGLLNFSNIGPRVLNNEIDRFWSLEDIGVKDNCYERDDDLAVQKFNESVQRVDGRYEVRWPWREGIPDLPDNYNLAHARLRSVHRKLRSQPELLKTYDGVIQNQLDIGIIERVPQEQVQFPQNPVHYLPHHAVIKPSSATTKVRIVHDASSKASKFVPSLNDCLLRGPVYLSNICGLHIRFRFHKVAYVCDIEKAFFQVGLNPVDRDVTRFFWLKDPFRDVTVENLDVFRFTKVLFGVISSPFLLGATVKHHLLQSGSATARDIVSNLYVDNYISGRDTVRTANEVFKEARRLFSDISMNLREWFTNSAEFRATIPKELLGTDPSTRVLGMVWDTEKDWLGYAKLDIPTEIRTKRQLVQAVSSVYDPCGYLAPTICKGKLLIQETWKRQVKWDEKLPQDMLDSWGDIRSDLEGIKDVKIPRYLNFTPNMAGCQLHCFCDASAKAYAAVVYMRLPTGASSLIFAKTKLAPIKQVSLPRLELMALLIGTRVIHFVKQQLEVEWERVIVWSDSKCVLQWVASGKVLSTFVSNRVREIKQCDAEFRHVPTKLNPADLPSRGVSLEELRNSELWWTGPSFMAEPESKWPKTDLRKGPIQIDAPVPEIDVDTFAQDGVSSESMGLFAIDICRFSNLSKLLRVSHLVQRYITILRHRVASRKHSAVLVTVPALQPSASDLSGIKLQWIRHIQQNCLVNFANFRNLKVQLQLFEDESGLFRCGGRLRHADLTEDAKFPILLPKAHAFTRLVIKQCHERVHHSGPSHTIAEVRATYWVPHLRSQVQSVIKHCATCKLWEGGPFKTPQHPPLPGVRVSKLVPFECTGIDYLGPLYVNNHETRQKVWICLFTCTATRAIHLEVVNALTTEQFLLALRRFIAVLGRPKLIISDNGKYFKLANDGLRQLWSSITGSSVLREFLANAEIEWKFITNYAPWMGGFYERLVGSVKRALKKVLGRQTVTLSQLQTIVAEVGSVLNSRPLLVSTDLSDQVLTPSDLLGKQRRLGLPACATDVDLGLDPNYYSQLSQKEELVAGWKHNESLLNQFWDIWKTEYLPALREAHRAVVGPRGGAEAPISEGALVLIKEANQPRSMWKHGVVQQAMESFDGVVRSALVRLPNGKTINRPIKLLFPIETDIGTGRTRTSQPSQNENSQFQDGNRTADEDQRQPESSHQYRPTIAQRPSRRAARAAFSDIHAQQHDSDSSEEEY